MPPTPVTGQGKDTGAHTVETGARVLRPRAKNARSETPNSKTTNEPQNPPSITPVRSKTLTSTTGTPKAKSTTSPALLKIAEIVEQIIHNFKPPGQVKQALTTVLELAKTAAEEAKEEGTNAKTNPVKIVHERFKADLYAVHKALDEKISDLQEGQKKLIRTTETLSKSTESLNSATKNLETKMVKVNDTTDKIANTTSSYRDALLAKPDNLLRNTADPKVIDDLDRKARQVLIAYGTEEENATLNVPLLDLKDKANGIITDLEDPTRPEVVRVESVTRTRNGSLLLLFNSKAAADWIREPDIDDKFLDRFAIGASIRDRQFNVMLRWVPIILDPSNSAHLREIEETNNLSELAIHKARWIKPINRRRSGQTRANAILTLSSIEVANRILKDGLEICGVKTRAERTKQEPLQCLKCRGWEHRAQDCKAEKDTCGTCGEDHRTNSCTNRGKLYCASCKSDAHASWDRNCPEFMRRCAQYDERYPENNMVYFPTEEGWTLTSRPNRIPVEERFPRHFAVNNTAAPNRNPHRPVVRLPSNRPQARNDTPQAQARQQPGRAPQREATDDPVSRLMNRSQPNLVPLGRGREQGELSEPAEFDFNLEYSDSAIVEHELDWFADRPYSPSLDAAWSDNPTRTVGW
jgi:hypothetical protein